MDRPQLSRVALEALFGAGAGDDVLAIAPAKLRAQAAVFIPECFEPLVKPVQLLPQRRVGSFGQAPPQLDPLLAQVVDVVVYLLQVPHVS